MASPFHLLQISDVLDLELGSALAEFVPVIGWEPQRAFFPALTSPGDEVEHPYKGNPALRLRRLPLLRGFARPPASWLFDPAPSIVERLVRQTPDAKSSPLICSIPYFASVAELWPGPVIYWLTDLIAEYSSANRRLVERLDRRLCSAATIVCPNSQRLAEYLTSTAQCDPAKVHIIPNATRDSSILPQPTTAPGPRPAAIAHISSPIAGVIGNLAGNMDWLLLTRLIDLTPAFHWVFVGPTSMQIADPIARKAREQVLHHPRASFVGKQPYAELGAYARTFDVAVLPYFRCEPTYSGSSTRFYEHLAACRPMIATPGLEELVHKQPLLTLIETPEEGAEAMSKLLAQNFDDGLAAQRWQASRNCTWQARAQTILTALQPSLANSVSTAA